MEQRLHNFSHFQTHKVLSAIAMGVEFDACMTIIHGASPNM